MSRSPVNYVTRDIAAISGYRNNRILTCYSIHFTWRPSVFVEIPSREGQSVNTGMEVFPLNLNHVVSISSKMFYWDKSKYPDDEAGVW